MKNKSLSRNFGKSDVKEFLNRLEQMPLVRKAEKRGRLIFALDATASREPLWDRACHIQAQMFEVTAALGGLDIQLCYYHGFEIFHASTWSNQSSALLREMTSVPCLAGHTQIRKVLAHALAETKKQKVNAVVFIGDCMEEDGSVLCNLAGELGILGVPLFIFHEGDEPRAAAVFRRMAKLSHGAYCYFDAGSAQHLGELLAAVAVYAAGGLAALDDYSREHGSSILQLSNQIKRD
ncbi:MAG: VWA domain-containing protein [Gammaproteobacteria bacterium]